MRFPSPWQSAEQNPAPTPGSPETFSDPLGKYSLALGQVWDLPCAGNHFLPVQIPWARGVSKPLYLSLRPQ